MTDNCVVIDFETTGMNAAEGARICEIGWTDVSFTKAGLVIGETKSSLVDPGCKIPPEMSAIHHITDEDVKGAPKAHEVLSEVLTGMRFVIAHNVEFEKQFVQIPMSWICTYKLARHFYPAAMSHKLQYFRYALDLNVDDDRAMPPHRAGPDSYMCAALFSEFAHSNIQALLDITNAPTIQHKVSFGEHKGKTWEEVFLAYPRYLQWIVNDSDFKGEVRDTALYWLRRS